MARNRTPPDKITPTTRDDREADWDAMAGLMSAIGNEQLPARLLDLIGSVVAYDSSLALVFHHSRQPLLLYEDFAHPWRENRIDTYLTVAYFLDPFYLACIGGPSEGLYKLEDIAPDGFLECEYYQSYYLHSHVSDEISYLIPCNDQCVICICIERRSGNPTFSDADVAELKRLMPIVSAASRKHWDLLQSDWGRDAATTTVSMALQKGLQAFGSSVLTRRECEVLRLLLRGHSIQSSADQLMISPGTIKVHREHVYAKLDVSSQVELFRLFIDSISTLSSDFDDDPFSDVLARR